MSGSYRFSQDQRGRFPIEILFVAGFGLLLLHVLLSASSGLGADMGKVESTQFDPVQNVKDFAWSLFESR